MNQFPLLMSVSAAVIVAILFYIAGNTAVKEHDQSSLKLFLLMFIGLWTFVFLRQHLLYDTLIVPATTGLVSGIGSATLAEKSKPDGTNSDDDNGSNSSN